MGGMIDGGTEGLRALFGRFTSLSRGEFRLLSDSSVADLDWNHMDKLHRPTIHRTYARFHVVARSPDIDVTLVRVAPFVFVLVNDLRVSPGRFLQNFLLLNLFYVSSSIRFDPEGGRTRILIEWVVASHALLRPFHGLLHWWMERLNRCQNVEDMAVRRRRLELKARGYAFDDEADFVSANHLSTRVRPPAPKGDARFACPPEGDRPRVFSAGGVDLLVRREGADVLVWHAVCLHEGGPLEKAVPSGGCLSCPWHGMESEGLRLSPGAEGRLPGMRLSYDGNELRVSPGGAG